MNIPPTTSIKALLLVKRLPSAVMEFPKKKKVVEIPTTNPTAFLISFPLDVLLLDKTLTKTGSNGKTQGDKKDTIPSKKTSQ